MSITMKMLSVDTSFIVRGHIGAVRPFYLESQCLLFKSCQGLCCHSWFDDESQRTPFMNRPWMPTIIYLHQIPPILNLYSDVVTGLVVCVGDDRSYGHQTSAMRTHIWKISVIYGALEVSIADDLILLAYLCCQPWKVYISSGAPMNYVSTIQLASVCNRHSLL